MERFRSSFFARARGREAYVNTGSGFGVEGLFGEVHWGVGGGVIVVREVFAEDGGKSSLRPIVRITGVKYRDPEVGVAVWWREPEQKQRVRMVLIYGPATVYWVIKI